MKQIMFFFFTIFLFTSCSPTKPGEPTMTGHWIALDEGASTKVDAHFWIDAQFIQSEESVSGKGTIQTSWGYSPSPITIDGTVSYPDVNLTISQLYVSITGQFVNDRTITAYVQGNGYEHYMLTFTRQ